MANVTANEEVEGTFDQSIQPESDYVRLFHAWHEHYFGNATVVSPAFIASHT